MTDASAQCAVLSAQSRPAAGVCGCGRAAPLLRVEPELPGLLVAECCGALYQQRGRFVSLVKEGSRTVHASAGALDARVCAGGGDAVGGPESLSSGQAGRSPYVLARDAVCEVGSSTGRAQA